MFTGSTYCTLFLLDCFNFAFECVFLFHYLICHYIFTLGICYALVCVCARVRVCSLSRVQLFATPWTVSRQAPLSVGFLRQEYWSGLPFLSPGDLPDPGIKLESPASAGEFFTSEPPGKPIIMNSICYFSLRACSS